MCNAAHPAALAPSSLTRHLRCSRIPASYSMVRKTVLTEARIHLWHRYSTPSTTTIQSAVRVSLISRPTRLASRRSPSLLPSASPTVARRPAMGGRAQSQENGRANPEGLPPLARVCQRGVEVPTSAGFGLEAKAGPCPGFPGGLLEVGGWVRTPRVPMHLGSSFHSRSVGTEIGGGGTGPSPASSGPLVGTAAGRGGEGLGGEERGTYVGRDRSGARKWS